MDARTKFVNQTRRTPEQQGSRNKENSTKSYFNLRQTQQCPPKKPPGSKWKQWKSLQLMAHQQLQQWTTYKKNWHKWPATSRPVSAATVKKD